MVQYNPHEDVGLSKVVAFSDIAASPPFKASSAITLFSAMEMEDLPGIMRPPMQIECLSFCHAAVVAVTYLYLLSFRSVLSL